jgi:hypothetical protein
MKIDLFREHRDEYAMPKAPALVHVGAGRYLSVEGHGAPSGEAFQKAMGALYGTAYTLKFAMKERGRDFKVASSEGLWSADGGAPLAMTKPKTTWRWKLLIRVPDFVTVKDARDALEALRAKKGPQPHVALETLREGDAVQMLHVGTYADEPRTLAKMDEFVRERKLRYRGAHHEIYLSDPRRVPSARLRTILRHPVVAARRPHASAAHR